MRAPVRPELLRWARERAGLREVEALLGRFPRLAEWEAGVAQPTLKQLDAFAHAVHVPVGYLFLPVPPDERLPISDYRTHTGRRVHRPSPELIDTLHGCQERQGWYREFAAAERLPEADFVGSATLADRAATVAGRMAERLEFDLAARAECANWEEALRRFIGEAERIGVLVMVSGIVRSDTHRPLDPEEFRGFALADRRAPLVFVNGADTKAGQMFTLAHELAHLWLGASGVSDAGEAPAAGGGREEAWSNAVAAELLVPLAALREALVGNEPLDLAMARLARHFKVSTLVILRRLLDVGALSRAAFEAAWGQERARLLALMAKRPGGGNFHRATVSRVGRRFARALVESTLEGQTLYRDAFRMLGVAKTATFDQIGREVGVER